MPQTLYQILDVTEAASDKEIKAAYRQAVLRHHPDKSAALGTPADALKYQELQNAWQVSAYAVLHMLHVCTMVLCQERSVNTAIDLCYTHDNSSACSLHYNLFFVQMRKECTP